MEISITNEYLCIDRMMSSVMICPRCGYKGRMVRIDDNIITCPECGKEFKEDEN